MKEVGSMETEQSKERKRNRATIVDVAKKDVYKRQGVSSGAK